MISQLFEYEDFDDFGCGAVYTDCIAKVRIGRFEQGSRFGLVDFEYDSGKITLYSSDDDSQIVGEYRTRLVVMDIDEVVQASFRRNEEAYRYLGRGDMEAPPPLAGKDGADAVPDR